MVAGARAGPPGSDVPGARARAARPGRGAREVLAVAVHGLAEQRQHAHPLVDQPARLALELVGDRPRAHAPARRRHDAVGAVQVAAAHHREVGVQPAGVLLTRRGRRRRPPPCRSRGAAPRLGAVRARAARAHLVDEARQVLELARAGHEVDVAGAAEDLFLDALRHAAHDPDHEPGPALLRALELADPAPGALLRVVAHRAGVEEQDVGLLHGLGRGIPRAEEAPLDQLGVVLVHLAAEGDDVHARGARVLPRAALGLVSGDGHGLGGDRAVCQKRPAGGSTRPGSLASSTSRASDTVRWNTANQNGPAPSSRPCMRLVGPAALQRRPRGPGPGCTPIHVEPSSIRRTFRGPPAGRSPAGRATHVRRIERLPRMCAGFKVRDLFGRTFGRDGMWRCAGGGVARRGRTQPAAWHG